MNNMTAISLFKGSRPTRSSGMRRTGYTMVELLVAMGVLVVMMYMLVRFFNGAQSAWLTTASNTRIYENARVVLDIIGKDLEGAVADNRAGSQIPFFVGPGDETNWNQRQLLAFVANATPSTNAASRLVEISYDVYTGTGHDANKYTFHRAICFDKDGGGDDTDWNFYGQTTASSTISTTNWNIDGLIPSTLTETDAEAQIVIKGVADVTITCYSDYSAPTVIASGTVATALPEAVVISVTLFDERLVDLETELGGAWQNRVDQTTRTFTKTIFLKRGI